MGGGPKGWCVKECLFLFFHAALRWNHCIFQTEWSFLSHTDSSVHVRLPAAVSSHQHTLSPSYPPQRHFLFLSGKPSRETVKESHWGNPKEYEGKFTTWWTLRRMLESGDGWRDTRVPFWESRETASWRTRNSRTRTASILIAANVTDCLSKRIFQVTFKRINRTRVSRSAMMFMQLTLTLRRGCHQPERVRCLNEH